MGLCSMPIGWVFSFQGQLWQVRPFAHATKFGDTVQNWIDAPSFVHGRPNLGRPPPKPMSFRPALADSDNLLARSNHAFDQARVGLGHLCNFCRIGGGADLWRGLKGRRRRGAEMGYERGQHASRLGVVDQPRRRVSEVVLSVTPVREKLSPSSSSGAPRMRHAHVAQPRAPGAVAAGCRQTPRLAWPRLPPRRP